MRVKTKPRRLHTACCKQQLDESVTVDLNRDCLGRVFNFLTTQEVASFAGVCREWRDAAYDATNKIIKLEILESSADLNVHPEYPSYDCEQDEEWMAQARHDQLVRARGHRQTQCAYCCSLCQYILRRATEVEVIIIDCAFDGHITECVLKADPFCKRLKILKLRDDTEQDWAVEMLPPSLVILDCNFSLHLPLHHGPPLTQLKILNATMLLDDNKNPPIANLFPGVEAMQLHCKIAERTLYPHTARVSGITGLDPIDLTQLQGAKSLKIALNAPDQSQGMTKHFLELRRLEDLQLSNWKLGEEDVEYLSQHPSLKTFSYLCKTCDLRAVGLLLELPQLTDLCIDCVEFTWERMGYTRTFPAFPRAVVNHSKLRNIVFEARGAPARINIGMLIKGAPNLQCIVLHGICPRSADSLLSLDANIVKAHKGLVIDVRFFRMFTEATRARLLALGYQIRNNGPVNTDFQIRKLADRTSPAKNVVLSASAFCVKTSHMDLERRLSLLTAKTVLKSSSGRLQPVYGAYLDEIQYSTADKFFHSALNHMNYDF